MKTIDIRRSVRKFKDKGISEEKIEAMLRAAMQAPSAGNQQPWEFVVVKNPAILEDLSNVSPYAGLIAKAPLAIVIICNQSRLKKADMWQQDMAAATQNLLLEAVYQELGAVWIGVSPIEDRVKHVKHVLDLEEGYDPFCVVALGVPVEGEENKYVDRFDETRITYLE